jgi:predicted ATPase/class 3 adenylate cyclase
MRRPEAPQTGAVVSAAPTEAGPGTPDGELPAGSSTVVLVLTDVEGSTRLWADHPEAMNAVMARHHQIVHGAVAAHGGWRPVDQGEGDAVFAAFDSATAAVAAVVEFQRNLAAEWWPAGIDIRVRVGVHAGEVTVRDGNLFGSTVNRCARLRGLAAGGQVVLSAPVFELVRDRLPDGVTVADLGEHRMKDLARPEHVHQVVIAGLPHEFPPLASLDRARHNLPVQTSSFLGRDREVAELVDLVNRERLVTITGFGGMGKTRLALQVAAELAVGDGDGVWFVDLSGLTDPGQVPMLIATTLGIGENADGVLSGLLAGVQDKRLLLVLDNLEQLLPDAALVVDEIVRAAAEVRVLATCREPLRLRGEREYPIAPLPLPPVHHGGWTESELASLSTYAAVSLFLNRAAGVRPDFTLTPSNAAAIAAICARLDGLPLALELAAARTRSMSPEALLPRLDRALKVLTGGSRDLPARHQTLRATIAWSYDALDPNGQQLLDRLSIFPGTFTLDAAEQICGPALDGEGEDLDVLDGIGALVDRSLLRHHSATDSQPDDRYDLLVSIRDYAGEKLEHAAHSVDMAVRHVAYFATLVALPLDYTRAQRIQQNTQLSREVHNIRAALDTAHQHDRTDEGLTLAIAAMPVLGNLGLLAEVTAIADRAVTQATRVTPQVVHLMIRRALEQRNQFPQRGARLAADALRAARALAEPSLLALGLISSVWGSTAPARSSALIAETRALIDSLPPSGNYIARYSLEASFDNLLAGLYYVEPDLGLKACRRLAQAERSDPLVQINLCEVLLHRGMLGEAEQIASLFEDPGNTAGVAGFHVIYGTLTAVQLRLAQGGLGLATTDLDLARRRLATASWPVLVTWADRLEAALLRARHDLSGAAERLSAVVDEAADDLDAISVSRACWLLAVITGEEGNPQRARALLDRAWEAAAGQTAEHLDLVLECLLERAVQLSGTSPGESVRLIGLVNEHRRDFILVDGVQYDTDALLSDLRERLGDGEVDRILASTVGQPLPDSPTWGYLPPVDETAEVAPGL